MRKMKLDLDELAVDSFETTTMEKEKGTVFGEQCTCYTNCTCPGCPTCNATCPASCNGTCGATCPASCNGSCDATCAGQWSCDNTCDSCYYTQCANTCYGCPTVSGSPCECWL